LSEKPRCPSGPGPELVALASQCLRNLHLAAGHIASLNEPAAQVVHDVGSLFLDALRREDVSSNVDFSEEVELRKQFLRPEDFEEMPFAVGRAIVLLAQRTLVFGQVPMTVIVDAKLEEKEDPPVGGDLAWRVRRGTGLEVFRKNLSNGRRGR
jgi:hypothetical protein